MHRIGVAACVAAALAILACVFHEADAAGIYEDAPAESAFLLTPRQIIVRATLEVTSGGADGSVYRLMAALPVRNAFFVSVDQPFVALTDSSHIDTGLGDLRLRGRARLWGGRGRALSLLGYVSAGTGNSRFFPYSSQTIDVNASAGYADSLGALTVWAIGGYTWVNHYPDDEVVHAAVKDCLRASAGASLALGSRSAVGVGALFLSYEGDARRDLLFANASYEWNVGLALFAEVQAETGRVGERVNDWGAIGGASVRF
jgi:hypothetical protein